MSDDEKVTTLFTLIDQKRDGAVDAAELADALRHRNKSLTLSDAIDRAIRTVAAFDADGDTKLSLTEFKPTGRTSPVFACLSALSGGV